LQKTLIITILREIVDSFISLKFDYLQAMFRGGATKAKCHDDFIAECANIFIEKVYLQLVVLIYITNQICITIFVFKSEFRYIN